MIWTRQKCLKQHDIAIFVSLKLNEVPLHPSGFPWYGFHLIQNYRNPNQLALFGRSAWINYRYNSHCDRYDISRIVKTMLKRAYKFNWISVHIWRCFAASVCFLDVNNLKLAFECDIWKEKRKCIYSHQKLTPWPSEMLNSHRMNITCVYTGFMFILVSTLLVVADSPRYWAKKKKKTSRINNLKFDEEKNRKAEPLKSNETSSVVLDLVSFPYQNIQMGSSFLSESINICHAITKQWQRQTTITTHKFTCN